jgi:DNA-binding NtrC family response regulator
MSRVAVSLERRGHSLLRATTGGAGVALLDQHGPGAVVLGLPLPDLGAAELMRSLKKIDPSIPIIVTGTDSDVTVPAHAFDLGAYEYLEDLGSDADFLATIGGAVGSRRGDLQLRYLRQRDATRDWDTLVRSSPSMTKIVGVLQQVCRRTSANITPTILLNGETGTGKGYIAKFVHYNSSRRNQAFVEVNCATLPPTLMEAELFGHERGAFTDAKAPRAGLFETAHGGTLFLDEIATIPLDLQAKLLTAIEEKKIRRIGGRQATQVNVQIITATHENLEQRIKEGAFRSDLFHRLNVVAVTLPPLRDRGEDALRLAEELIETIGREYGMPPRRLTREAREWISRYSWPGNVRELRNRIERILLLEEDDMVRPEHFGPSPSLPSDIRVQAGPSGTVNVSLPADGVPLEELEYAVLREALARCGGNVSRAARFLSVSRQTLIYRMKKYRLDRNDNTSGTFPIADEREQVGVVSADPRPR